MQLRSLTLLLMLSLSLAHCTGKQHFDQPSLNKREIQNTIIDINFPLKFKGETESLQIINAPKDQSFLFCCELKMNLPRSAVIHLRLNTAEAYSPLNHSTENERLCAYLDTNKVKREKAVLSNPLLLDLKATILIARDEEIPEGNVTNCKLSNIYDNRFLEPEAPYFEHYSFPKEKLKKRVVVFGSGTLIDQGNSSPPPFISEKIADLYSEAPLEIINLATWSATLLDHLMSWDKIQQGKEKAPLSRPYFSQAYTLSSFPYLLQTSINGAKDLKPDLVVISSMWTDFPTTSPLFNTPANVIKEYLQTLLESSLSPSDQKAKKLFEISKKISSYPAASEQFRFEQMRLVYSLNLEDLIKKIRRDIPGVPILLITLPLGLNDSFLDKELLLKKLRQTDFYEKNFQISFDPMHWSSVEKAQNEIAQKLSVTYKKVTLLNLSQEYTENFSQAAANRILSYNYFAPDFMHFSSAGNSFVATRLNQKIQEILTKGENP